MEFISLESLSHYILTIVTVNAARVLIHAFGRHESVTSITDQD